MWRSYAADSKNTRSELIGIRMNYSRLAIGWNYKDISVSEFLIEVLDSMF